MSEKEPMHRGGPLDLDELGRLAQAASPGPWRSWIEGRDHFAGDAFVSTDDDNPENDAPDLYPKLTSVGLAEWNQNWHADQDYIAAANPKTVLELIAKIRELEQAR
jgi:hypothetical protein